MEVLATSRTPKNQILLSDMSISSSLSLVLHTYVNLSYNKHGISEMEEVSVEKALHFIRLNIMARRKSQNFVYIQANCGFHKSRERKFARSNYEGCCDILSHACPKCQLLTDTDLVKSEDETLIFEKRNSS